MKKLIAITAALLIAAAMYQAGRHEGIKHAIEDAEIYTFECDDTIYIELDGDVYEHGPASMPGLA